MGILKKVPLDHTNPLNVLTHSLFNWVTKLFIQNSPPCPRILTPPYQNIPFRWIKNIESKFVTDAFSPEPASGKGSHQIQIKTARFDLTDF